MPWFRVDDKLHDHRKARNAGLPAMGLWCIAGSWVADNLMNGFVPASVCQRWDRGYARLASRLVDVGLWEPGELDGEPGWWFHDWKSMQPSREDVLSKRAGARERMARVRANKPDGSREQTANTERSSQNVRVTPVPDPVPDPTPVPTQLQKRAPTTSQEFIAEWLEHTPKRPPAAVVGQVAKVTASLLAEGIDPSDVRNGLAAWASKGLHPSTLPSVVNEVMNAPTRASPSGHGPATQKFNGWMAVGDDMRNLHEQMGGNA